MRKRGRRGVVLALALVGVGAACAPADLFRVAERGIGGTGMSSEDRGIGGTGIYGTVTAFGSVIVNGLTVAYDAGTPTTLDRAPATAAALAVGQVVAIEADDRGGRLSARSIAVESAVVGPVAAVAAAGDRLTVLGQSVRVALPPATPLRAGDWVAVSGLRTAQDEIVASRVEPRAPGGTAVVTGAVTAATASGFRIGDLAVEAPQSPAIGRTVTVSGSVTATGVRAASVIERPAAPFGGRVARVSIEGYVSRAPAADRALVSGFAVAPGRVGLTPDTRVAVEGRLDRGGLIEVDRVDAIGPGRGASDPGRDRGGAGRSDGGRGEGAGASGR
jgi:hypothetical protein